jgi:hypothetical protein
MTLYLDLLKLREEKAHSFKNQMLILLRRLIKIKPLKRVCLQIFSVNLSEEGTIIQNKQENKPKINSKS